LNFNRGDKVEKLLKSSIVAIVGVALIVFLIRIIGLDFYNNTVDKIAWNKMLSIFIEENILKVKFSGANGTNIELVNGEKNNFVRKLRDAKFHKSNWRKEGPTPTVIIEIVFKDGVSETFGYWGKGVFETSYGKSQFLIFSSDIENVLLKQNIPNI